MLQVDWPLNYPTRPLKAAHTTNRQWPLTPYQPIVLDQFRHSKRRCPQSLYRRLHLIAPKPNAFCTLNCSLWLCSRCRLIEHTDRVHLIIDTLGNSVEALGSCLIIEVVSAECRSNLCDYCVYGLAWQSSSHPMADGLPRWSSHKTES